MIRVLKESASMGGNSARASAEAGSEDMAIECSTGRKRPRNWGVGLPTPGLSSTSRCGAQPSRQPGPAFLVDELGGSPS
jgi:hypothetical protein